MDELAWIRTLSHAFELWVNPELERRGYTSERHLALRAVHVLLNPLGGPAEVRLNDEVRLEFVGRPARPVQKGEVVNLDKDLQSIEEVRIPPAERDFGHFVAVYFRGGWFVQFDLRYYRGKAGELIEAGREFVETAEAALASGKKRVFVDSLFGAAELLSLAELALLRDEEALRTKKHGGVQGAYGRWLKRGRGDPRYLGVYQTLGKLREPARYLRREFQLSDSDAKAMLDVVQEMYSRFKIEQLGHRDGLEGQASPSLREKLKDVKLPRRKIEDITR